MWNWLKKVVAAAEPGYCEPERPVATTVGTLAAARRSIIAAVFSGPYRENYVLRGSVLLRSWLPGTAREPNDIDLVTAYPHDPDRCTREILEIFRRGTGEEDIVFSLHPENILPMWEYDIFPGVRFHIPWAITGGKRESTQLDVAFDNTPPLPGEWIDLDFRDGRPPVPVRAWTPEACLASKIGWIATDSEDFGWPDDDDLLDTRLLAGLDGLKIDRLHESLRLLLQGRDRDLTLFEQFDLRLQTALDWPPGSEDRLQDYADRFFPWQQHRNIFRWLRNYVDTALAIAPHLRGFAWLPDRDDFALMNKLRNEPGAIERLTPEERKRHDRLRETAPAKWQGALFPRQNR